MSNSKQFFVGCAQKIAVGLLLTGAAIAGSATSSADCVQASGGSNTSSNCGVGNGYASSQGSHDDSATNGKIDYDGTQNADDRDATQDAYSKGPIMVAVPQYR